MKSFAILTLPIYGILASSNAFCETNNHDIRQYRDLSNSAMALTPARMGQTIEDTPGSVTVLKRDQLLNQGIETIPEALRLVPGMSVLETTGYSQSSGHDYRIAYHGGSALVPRRLQVMVDGMSVYLAGLSKIDWAQLPVTVHDIERIEVTRNPSAASYGANSFQAVVNIITRHSADVPNHEASVQAGNRNDHFAFYRGAAGFGETTLTFRASQWRDNGYDEALNAQETGSAAPGSRDTTEVSRFLLRGDTLIQNDTELTIQIGAVTSKSESEYVVSRQESGVFPDIETEDYFFNGQLIHTHNDNSETRMQAYWKRNTLEQDFRACSPAVFILPESYALLRANPDYFDALLNNQIPSGGTTEDDALALALMTRVQQLGTTAFTPVCGTLNQDYKDERQHLTVEHHRFLTPELRWLAGATYEQLKNTSETYFTGYAQQSIVSGFMNVEWKPVSALTSNIGFMAEYPENIDELVFSPRASLNWHIHDTLSARWVVNRAFRTPDLAETDRSWNYRVRDISPVIDGITDSIFADYASSEGFNLQPERIDATEIGILYQGKRLTLDSRVFYEDLDDLITEKPAYADFQLSNNGSGTVQGFEVSGRYPIFPELYWDINYSYQDHDFTSLNEQGLNSEHSGSTALTFDNNDRTITFSYIGHSDQMNNSLDRWKISWREHLRTGNTALELFAHIQYQPSDVIYAEPAIDLAIRYTHEHTTYAELGIALRL